MSAEPVPVNDWVASFERRIAAEAEAWKPYACKGDDANACQLAKAYETCDRSEQPRCPRIQAFNRIARVKQEREEADRQARERGVPVRCMRVLDGPSVKETAARSAVLEWINDRKLGSEMRCFLVLAGGKGCGKTLAAAEAAREHVGTFVDIGHVVRVGQYETEALSEMQTAGLLVIDDLGCEYVDAKGYFNATLDGLINARYANERATIITTNLPAKAFSERYGERVADRLREAGKYVELTDLSLRGKP